MTKTYLGYGYTNNRGVAKLEYTPNNEKLTTTGYKNTHTNNTQITAQITHKNKTYQSNTKQYTGQTTPTTPTIIYSNDGTKKDLQLLDGGTYTITGGHLSFEDCYDKRIMLPVSVSGNWEFSFDTLSQNNLDFIIGAVIVSAVRIYEPETSIKLVYEQGIIKEYVNGTLKNSQTISVPSNYNIGLKAKVRDFSLDNLQLKQWEE